MKRVFNSLTFKVGIVIILVEIVILTAVGFFYVYRFNQEIEERIESRLELMATLIDNDLLPLNVLADEEAMKSLIGETLIDVMVVSSDGGVLVSTDPKNKPDNISERPEIDPAWFDPEMADNLIEGTPDGLVGVSRIGSLLSAADADIQFFVYIKLGAEQAEIQKRGIIGLFVFGSIVTVVITSVAIILVFNSTVFNRIRSLLGVLERVELGDLAVRVTGPISADEIGVLQRGVNSMVAQLEAMVGSLEQRVAERSRALEVSAGVSRRLSTILDREQLIAEVVEQVRAAFNYYYTQIYLFDETREHLLLARGTGEVGRIMFERGHNLPKGRGLVGRAADKNTPVLVRDVSRSIGVEVITQANVAEVYQRESVRAVETQWYADWLAACFSEVEIAKQLANERSTDQSIQIGYVLHITNEFTDTMQRGAEAAARDLQVDLEIKGPAFPFEHRPLFETFVSAGKDGLVTVPTDGRWSGVIQAARGQGIPVVTANVPSQLADITKVVPANFQSSSVLAREVTRLLVAEGKQRGKIILGPGIRDRIAGFLHGMRGSEYTMVQIDESLERSHYAIRNYWQRTIDKHADLVAAVGLQSDDVPILAELKRNSGGTWLVAGYDLNIETLQAIQEGVAQIAIGQHPYLQGYLPILALVEHLRRGQSLETWMAEGWLPNRLLPETKAEMAVPISIGAEVLGVLDVQHNVAGSLKQENLDLLQSIADQVSIGLQNARLFSEVEAALAETRAAHARYLERAWEKDKAVRQGGQYHYACSDATDLDESILEETKRQALAQSHTSIVMLDDGKDVIESQDHPRESIASPITLRDNTIGVLQLHPTSDDQHWTEDDLAIVEAVADQLAQSAESLRLFEETRERAGREQTIREITDKLRAAPNLDSLLETAARELGQRLGVRHTVLELGIETDTNGDDMSKSTGAKTNV